MSDEKNNKSKKGKSSPTELGAAENKKKPVQFNLEEEEINNNDGAAEEEINIAAPEIPDLNFFNDIEIDEDEALTDSSSVLNHEESISVPSNIISDPAIDVSDGQKDDHQSEISDLTEIKKISDLTDDNSLNTEDYTQIISHQQIIEDTDNDENEKTQIMQIPALPNEVEKELETHIEEEVSKDESFHAFEYIPQSKFHFLSQIKDFIKEIPEKLKKRNLKEQATTFLNNKKSTNSTSSFNKWVKKIDANEIQQNFFSAKFRPKIHELFIFTIIIIFFYQIGNILSPLLLNKENAMKKLKINKSIAKNNASNSNLSNIDQIGIVNLFNAKLDSSAKIIKSTKVKTIDKNLVCLEASAPSSLEIKLQSTIVLQDSIKSLASVSVRGNKKVLSLRVGEKITNLATIGKIGRLKVILKNLKTGNCEYIEKVDKKFTKISSKSKYKIHQPKEGKKLMKSQKRDGITNDGNDYSIKKSIRDEMLTNIDEVLSQAEALQIKNPDGSLAFKMTNIVPGSIYSNLDIQNGDIIKSINGKNIKAVNELLNLFGKIKTIDSFQIGVSRNGSDITKNYTFEN